MAIYDINGNSLNSAYDIDGSDLATAYDIDGDIVFQKQSSTVIKAMSFNVGCFYTQYFPCPDNVSNDFYQRHWTIFNNHKPDVCGMPEWYDSIGTIGSNMLMGEFWDYYIPNYEAYNGSSKPHNAITFASKYQMKNNSITAYANQSGEVRYYQKAYITVNGKNICFLNTHLGTSDIRNAQFVEMLNVLENEEYFIAMGDFNFRIEAVGDSEYNLSVKLALDRGYNSAQSSSGIYMTGYHGETVETSTSITALDNIITSANLPISNVAIDTTKLADGLCTANNIIIDHLPIVCDITVN